MHTPLDHARGNPQQAWVGTRHQLAAPRLTLLEWGPFPINPEPEHRINARGPPSGQARPQQTHARKGSLVASCDISRGQRALPITMNLPPPVFQRSKFAFTGVPEAEFANPWPLSFSLQPNALRSRPRTRTSSATPRCDQPRPSSRSQSSKGGQAQET